MRRIEPRQQIAALLRRDIETLGAKSEVGQEVGTHARLHLGPIVSQEATLSVIVLQRNARAALRNSECGALLLFDVNNIRYVSGTKIGEWGRDKFCRFALLTEDGEPIVWDFGSAAVHHRLYCDWLDPSNCRAGVLGMRGTIPPSFA